MKQLIYILFLFPFFAFAKEQPTPSTIKKVTVFIEGGQVMREASTHLPKGKTEIILEGLSKHLDPKSIRVKGIGDFTILAIRNQLDYLDKKKSMQDDILRKQIKDLTLQIKILRLEHQTLSEKQTFLTENKKITGTNTPISYSDYDQFYKLYGDEIHQIFLKKNEIEINSEKLKMEQQDLVKQLHEIADKERKGFYKIIIIAQADRPMPAKFEISYYVANCGWFPTYDIRIDNLKEPVNLSYKANLRQMTGVDWANVMLTFSNAMPTDAGDVPELLPFYLGEYRGARHESSRVHRVSGVVTDQNGEPLIGASVIVSGTTIGVTTDFDGKYSLSIPKGVHDLEVMYLGYETQLISASSSVLNIALRESDSQLSSVVVTAYSSKMDEEGVEPSVGLLSSLSGKMAGVSISTRKEKSKQESKAIQMDLKTNTTSLEFEIKVPYTILSKPKSQVIEMRNFDMSASYEYQIVPKIEAAAYLMAYITDWEQFHLMDGESNLYFENTYVGKALIEATSVKDTLQLSLGKDKSIAVTRTNIKDKSSQRLIGNKKIIKKSWKTEIKNNKSIPIKVLVFDQIPVSRKKKIEVSDVKYGSAKYDEVTGEIRWQTEIPGHDKEIYRLDYTVKYPKGWSIVVE